MFNSHPNKPWSAALLLFLRLLAFSPQMAFQRKNRNDPHAVQNGAIHIGTHAPVNLTNNSNYPLTPLTTRYRESLNRRC
jgi:hypothetical protein